MGKAAKGSVQVQVVKGRLRLCWRYEGIRYWLPLGYPDEPRYRKMAQFKASQIEGDILYSRFDPADIQKYRSAPLGSPKSPELPSASLREIWAGFVDWKRSQCSPSTMKSQYQNFTRHIQKFPIDNPYEAVQIQNYLLRRAAAGETTIGVVKRLLVALGDMGKWAVKQKLLESNPFAGMSGEIRISRSVGDEEEDIDPFTAEERDRIIQKFKGNRYYAHYTPMVEFLFRTGCRPSEALALTWRQIGKGYKTILFDQALVEGENGFQIKRGLKTQERRTIVLNESLQNLLRARRTSESKPDGLIFPAPKGGLLKFQNFAKRGWATILRACGLDYRNPYQTRHTFITLALQGGMHAKDIAQLVGSSAEMIHKHYLGVTRDLRLPEV